MSFLKQAVKAWLEEDEKPQENTEPKKEITTDGGEPISDLKASNKDKAQFAIRGTADEDGGGLAIEFDWNEPFVRMLIKLDYPIREDNIEEVFILYLTGLVYSMDENRLNNLTMLNMAEDPEEPEKAEEPKEEQ